MSNECSDRTQSEGSDFSNPKPEELIQNKYSIQQCMDVAERSVQDKTACSQILDGSAERNVPKFDVSELSIGRILGKGAFCDVREISKIKLVHSSKVDIENYQRQLPQPIVENEGIMSNFVQDRYFMEQHYLRGQQNDCRYAIKAVQASSKSNVQTYIHAVADLAIEARFLSVISHPNIIKMRAMAHTSPFSITQPFFVVLDRLYDILGTRIKKWKKRRPSGLAKVVDCSGIQEQVIWHERISALYDLAMALQYLHESNIVYRDFKPDNIGFDIRDDVKLFDFGLAKELDPSKQDENGLYNLTSDTGSLRYMAPEVFLGKPYNHLVDVYSFSTLMWQVLKLETPFVGYTVSLIKANVYERGIRMKCDQKWSLPLREIIERGWSGSIQQRPEIKEIADVLRSEMSSGICTIQELDETRKSEKSLIGLYSYAPNSTKLQF